MERRPKILLIDDDRDLVEALHLALEAAGYEVIAAYNPTEGYFLAENERPDLILLDVMMPTGTEGFHFVWKLRQHADARLRATPIVVLTAIHEKTSLRFYPESGDDTYQAGEYLPVEDFVDKPVSTAKLLDTLRRVLAARR